MLVAGVKSYFEGFESLSCFKVELIIELSFIFFGSLFKRVSNKVTQF